MSKREREVITHHIDDVVNNTNNSTTSVDNDVNNKKIITSDDENLFNNKKQEEFQLLKQVQNNKNNTLQLNQFISQFESLSLEENVENLKLNYEIITFNVGGKLFYIPLYLLDLINDNENSENKEHYLTLLYKNKYCNGLKVETDNNDNILIDRNPNHFENIINYLRVMHSFRNNEINIEILTSMKYENPRNYFNYLFDGLIKENLEKFMEFKKKELERLSKTKYGKTSREAFKLRNLIETNKNQNVTNDPRNDLLPTEIDVIDLINEKFIDDFILRNNFKIIGVCIEMLIQFKEECDFYGLDKLSEYLEKRINLMKNPFDEYIMSLQQEENEVIMNENNVSSIEKEVEKVASDNDMAISIINKLNDNKIELENNNETLQHYKILMNKQITFKIGQFKSITIDFTKLIKYSETKLFTFILYHYKQNKELYNNTEKQTNNIEIMIGGGLEVFYMLKYIKEQELNENDFNWISTNINSVKQAAIEFQFKEFEMYITHCFVPNKVLKKVIGEQNWRMKKEEDILRESFVTQRETKELNECSKSLLISVLENLQSFKSQMDIDVSKEKLLFNFEDFNNKYNQKHDPLVSPEIVTCKEEFEFNFKHFTKDILKNLNFSNVCIAGGGVLAPLLRLPPIQRLKERYFQINRFRKYRVQLDTTTDMLLDWYYFGRRNRFAISNSDIDLFLYDLTEEQAKEKIKEIVKTIRENCGNGDVVIIKSGVSISLQVPGHRTIQIILRIYKNISEILCGFDVDCCCFAFDGKKVFSTPRGRRSIIYRYNMIDIDRQSYTYEKRLYKYANRGFRIFIPNYNPLFIRREGLQNIKDEAFSLKQKRIPTPSYKNCRGLALLLLEERRHLKAYRQVRRFHSESAFINRLDDKLQENRNFQKNNFDNDSDYCDINFFNSRRNRNLPASILVNKVKNFINHFKNKIQEELNEKGKVINSRYDIKLMVELNNIDYILNDSTILPLTFVTVNPGRQDKIGSFHPHTKNFYEDAYLNYRELFERKLQDNNSKQSQQQQENGNLSIIPLYWVRNYYNNPFYWELVGEGYKDFMPHHTVDEIEKEYQQYLKGKIDGKETECCINFTNWRYYGKTEVLRELSFEYLV
ncbi:hypothetical protein ABK040_005040 [Willaertia magna]